MQQRFPLFRRLARLGLIPAGLTAWFFTFYAFWFTESVLPRETVTLPKEWPCVLQVSSNSRVAVLHHAEFMVPGGRRAIRLWDMETQRLFPELPDQTDCVLSAAFSPDGVTFATVAQQEEIVRVWDLATSRELRTFRVPEDRPIIAAYSPDGKSLVAAWPSGARRWDMADGRELATFKFGTGQLLALRFTAEGRAVVVVNNNHTRVVEFWELDSGRQLRAMDLSKHAHLYQLAVSLDGRTLASTHLGGAVKLWDVATGEVLEVYTVSERHSGLAFSPDGRWLAVCHEHSSVVGSRILSWVPQLGPMLGHALSGESGTVVIDRATRTSWSGLPYCWPNPAFSADGARLITLGDTKGMQYFDLPPHRQPFTPFAWGFLAAALALSGVWWRLRRTRQDAVAKKP